MLKRIALLLVLVAGGIGLYATAALARTEGTVHHHRRRPLARTALGSGIRTRRGSRHTAS